MEVNFPTLIWIWFISHAQTLFQDTGPSTMGAQSNSYAISLHIQHPMPFQMSSRQQLYLDLRIFLGKKTN
ncbi:hypothetical protein AAZX31_02G090900 [Glycine max]